MYALKKVLAFPLSNLEEYSKFLVFAEEAKKLTLNGSRVFSVKGADTYSRSLQFSVQSTAHGAVTIEVNTNAILIVSDFNIEVINKSTFERRYLKWD